jgi:hypothetical protein
MFSLQFFCTLGQMRPQPDALSARCPLSQMRRNNPLLCGCTCANFPGSAGTDKDSSCNSAEGVFQLLAQLCTFRCGCMLLCSSVLCAPLYHKCSRGVEQRQKRTLEVFESNRLLTAICLTTCSDYQIFHLFD